MCEHRYDNDPTGPRCTREDPHDETRWGGHVYKPASGLTHETTEAQ